MDINNQSVVWQALVADILQQAKAQGASSAEVTAGEGTGFSVTVRLGEVETVEYNQDKGVTITVYFGQSKGSTTTSDISPAAIAEAITAACHIARFTAADSYAGLADVNLMAIHYPDLDLYYPWGIDTTHAIQLATECEDKGRAFDKRIGNSEGASVSSHQGIHVYGNSHGFIGAYASTRHSMNCSLIAQEGGQMQRDYDYTVARDPQELYSPALVARNAAERAVKRLHAKRLKTCQAPVIFRADVATGLIGHFLSAIRGSNLYRQSSFLLNQLGQQVFAKHMHIYEDPYLKKGLGSAPFDAEGVKTMPRDLIQAGILQGYVLNSYAARKLDMQTTGNAGGVHNVTVQAQDIDFNNLIKQMGTGLIVTELLGQGVNIVTGDYSRGAAGFWVEQGEIQFPVEEITIAGNLREMFMHIIAVANDVDKRGNIRTGSILIENMAIAGE